MAREIYITIYLYFFKMFFKFFNLFPLKEKIVFVITFGDNSRYIYEEIRKRSLKEEIVVLYKGSSYKHFLTANQVQLIPFESANIVHMIRSIYHLATSRFVLIDNYFGFLSATDFKEEVECIQLWHASGAIKKFGFVDEATKYRSKRSQKRFSDVYKKFNKVIVGSDIMANFFKQAFDLKDENILKIGIPRTDFFFNRRMMEDAVNKLLKGNPVLSDKKKILYAPTYREEGLAHFDLKLDIQKMYEELGDEYVILLRLHPAVKNSIDFPSLHPGFLYDYSSEDYVINELLLISDYLITDYSSIPYEYSLLNKPMIFFAYDMEHYKKSRGLWEQYESTLPGPIVKSTTEVAKAIKDNEFDLQAINKYAEVWNEYSKGYSSKNLVDYLFKKRV
ncbi:CDP-glycerol glycerophosphotransferase (TagB/SpsB family) [Cytobacillus firmus]|uniref:CDP-glycerol glycerophosphotransferase (TagB/SpsB family) n=2 Tax=Cytobacillus TaxID=2675230 RepID=A0A366JVN4_CYTFI|nr:MULTISPECIES: CDP-glycerol glycerophosphotransferase family protein [Cytobacillus]RBP91522.1 CDP-glycerol glycerophosphotransferase (TagB/SpsB family) [Cytobacillus firmus]TDX41722.1 CDP-glycerol glycerophosphotransferase (TagB/SpsB family) [Cytobacillus oceanisediminis]